MNAMRINVAQKIIKSHRLHNIESIKELFCLFLNDKLLVDKFNLLYLEVMLSVHSVRTMGHLLGAILIRFCWIVTKYVHDVDSVFILKQKTESLLQTNNWENKTMRIYVYINMVCVH